MFQLCSLQELPTPAYVGVTVFVSVILPSLYLLCHYAVGRFENQKKWIFTIAQVDPMDAHKNNHICVLRYCFWKMQKRI